MNETHPMKLFLWGASALACWAIGTFFFRFWRETRDRFFALFAVAFWVLALDWLALALFNPPSESRAYFYLVRLLAFVLIAAAVVDKNRSQKPGPD
jgi:hypothetical protein